MTKCRCEILEKALELSVSEIWCNPSEHKERYIEMAEQIINKVNEDKKSECFWEDEDKVWNMQVDENHKCENTEYKTVIYKYPLVCLQKQTLTIPAFSKFRHIGVDRDNKVCMWIEINKEHIQGEVDIYLCPTGVEIINSSINPSIFLGTVSEQGYIWHFFMKPNNVLIKE